MNCGRTVLNWGWPEASTLTSPRPRQWFLFWPPTPSCLPVSRSARERHRVPKKLLLGYSRPEYPPMCMLSVFVPAHFWPSLKHLSSRCCSWQALHDIKSEILTENQSASRPLAAPIYSPPVFLHCAKKHLCVLCLAPPDLQLTPTWNKLLYHNPLCPFVVFPRPRGRSSCVQAAD